MGLVSERLRARGDDDLAWALLDAVPDATLIVAADGEIVFANVGVEAVFGHPAAELVGMVVDELVPESSRGVHRAHRVRYLAEPSVRPMGSGIDLRARHRDGSEFPVEVSLSPLRLGDEVYAVAAVRDISGRLSVEDQLRRVLGTLDASDDGVFMFDASTLRFTFVNDGAVRMSGYSCEELLAMSPLHLDPDATDAEYRALVRSLLADPAATAVREGVLIRKAGVEVAVESSLHSAPAGRDASRWIVMLTRDVTARRSAEAELARSQEALRRAEAVLAIADDRERIARDLHDTVIQQLYGEALNLQAAVATVEDPRRTRERLDAAVDGIDSAIKELRMTVFRLQGGSVAPGGLRGRLLNIVTDVNTALGFEPRLQFDGLLETIDDEVAEHLTAVLREALSNVVRHADADRVRVAVEVGDHVTLAVADNGAGVPSEVLGGNGLTNMASRARDLGGRFDVTPQPGGGTLLVWRVPSHPPTP